MDTLEISHLEIYSLAVEYGQEIWDNVATWHYFEQKTIGLQLARSADSVSANMAEGIGRYHYKDRLRFFYFSRGSLYESRDWLGKSIHRRIISPDIGATLQRDSSILTIKLNAYIKSIRKISDNQ